MGFRCQFGIGYLIRVVARDPFQRRTIPGLRRLWQARLSLLEFANSLRQSLEFDGSQLGFQDTGQGFRFAGCDTACPDRSDDRCQSGRDAFGIGYARQGQLDRSLLPRWEKAVPANAQRAGVSFQRQFNTLLDEGFALAVQEFLEKYCRLVTTAGRTSGCVAAGAFSPAAIRRSFGVDVFD